MLESQSLTLPNYEKYTGIKANLTIQLKFQNFFCDLQKLDSVMIYHCQKVPHTSVPLRYKSQIQLVPKAGFLDHHQRSKRIS